MKIRTATLSVLGVLALVGASLTASGSGASALARSSHPALAVKSASTKYTIAMVPGDSTDSFYITMRDGAQAEAKKLGITLNWEGSPTFDPTDQFPILEALLAKHPSGLIVTPTDPNALTSLIKEFDYGPVVTTDEYLTDTSFLTSAITSDNVQGGGEAADACATLTGGTGGVAVIYTTPGTTTTNLRGQGFIKQIKSKYHKMQVVATEFDNNEASLALTQTESLILGHPTLKCIFATNTYAATGVARGVVDEHAKGKVFVAGYDSAPDMRTMLANGSVQVAIAQDPALEGTLAVEYVHDALVGKTSLIKKSVHLPNITITRKNMKEPSISKYFYKTS
jgi:ribose transport system substrate-binding protein